MNYIRLNKCLDKESRYYGLTVFGLILASVAAIIMLMTVNLLACIIAFAGIYPVGAYISKLWHEGAIQRYIYWNLPSQIFKYFLPKAEAKYLPSSHIRRYI